jgi:hypothetical protein
MGAGRVAVITSAMDTNELVRQLTEERDRIDAAIKLLSGLDTPTEAARKKRKPLSAGARKRISEAQKKRWAAKRKKV